MLARLILSSLTTTQLFAPVAAKTMRIAPALFVQIVEIVMYTKGVPSAPVAENAMRDAHVIFVRVAEIVITTRGVNVTFAQIAGIVMCM